jgi:hypothetical protein
MSDDPTANRRAVDERGGGRRPLSSLCREIGLASVAIELNLKLNTLEPDVAEAIERGAAALFHAGYGPSLIRHRQSVWAREKGSRHGVRRRASKAGRSGRYPAGKPAIELRDETDGIRAAPIGAYADVKS